MLSVLVSLLLAQPAPVIEVRDEGVKQGYVVRVDCVGAGVSCTKTGYTWTLSVAGSSGGYATVQDEGSDLTTRTKLNFIGAGVTCADNAGATRTDCTIPGGSTSAAGSQYELQYAGVAGAFAADPYLNYFQPTHTLNTPGIWVHNDFTSGYALRLEVGDRIYWGQTGNVAIHGTNLSVMYLAAAGGIYTQDKLEIATTGVPGYALKLSQSDKWIDLLAVTSGDVIKMGTGGRLHLGTGTNDYLYSDGTNILTPGSITATGGFVGNASTAAALNSTGGAGTFWANNNTWQTPPGGGSPPGGVSGDIQTNSGSGTFAAYGGATCAAPGFVRVLSASGAATCASLRLDQLVNPTGDTTFTYPSGTKMLWTFTGSTDEAFSIHGDGAFTGTGDLVHINKTGTGASVGSDALHVEVTDDTNMTGLRVTMVNATRDAINTNAKVTAAGGFFGALTGLASTATALAADPADCSAGQAPLGITASGAVTGCFTPAGTYTLPAATATVLGGVKGTGTLLVCSGTDKATGFAADGTLQCATDQTGGAGSVDMRAFLTSFGGF